MSEKVYVAMVLFFILLAFLALVYDVDTEVKNWLFLRAEKKRRKKNQTDVSEEAERTEEGATPDLWEEIMRENNEEIRQQLAARERDERTWENLRHIRESRIAREELIRQRRLEGDLEAMTRQRQADQTRLYNSRGRNSTTNTGNYGYYNMGTYNMADSPRPPDAAPAAYQVGDIVQLHFSEHERRVVGDYNWQRQRPTIEEHLHGQYVILKHQHVGADYLWDVAMLNEADCPPNLIGRQLVVREKCFVAKKAPAVAYPKKVRLTEGGLPKL